jgi:hydrogenase nickel incorporation protein HypA/HybF
MSSNSAYAALARSRAPDAVMVAPTSVRIKPGVGIQSNAAGHGRCDVHELSICGSIADIVKRRAADRSVEKIHLRIGQLRQVVPDTLVYCWGLVSAETELDGSVLEVENVQARILCKECGATTLVGDLPLFMCHECNGVDVSVVSGEEFLITALELAEA